MCGRTERHDENECPFAHANHDPGRRRDHKRRYYSYERCLHFSDVGDCPEKDACLFAHGDNEVWFHPLFYRTHRCSDALACNTRFCPFVHTDEEDRTDVVRHAQRNHLLRLLRLSNQEPPRPRLDPIARPPGVNIGVQQQQEPDESVLAAFPTDLSRAIPPLQADDAAPLEEALSKRKHISEAGSSNN
ncbi:hypothetical protein C2S52_005093 [Perilla frutescens var. hirtella]|nr:hypothetical protein C2S51_010536 [Perilla frutescens var. frutescens]KAH6794616.1 hypothetical protein C2S52_005093 [Perilla frutescens var. hirtella]